MSNADREEFDRLPEWKKREVLRWLSIITAFEDQSKAYGKGRRRKAANDFIERYSMEYPEEKPFNRSTLFSKIKAYREQGAKGLINKYGKVKRSIEWPEEAKAYLRQLYLHINSPAAAWCIYQLRMEASKKGWDLPSDRTLNRFLLQIPEETRAYYRKGERFWKERFMPSVLRDYESISPGEIYVSDHAQINVAVRHTSGRILFPWFTGWLDMRTRKIVGYCLAEKPSGDTINLSFMNALKENCPAHAIIDNGRDFSSPRFSGKSEKRNRFKFSKDEQAGIFRILGVEPHYCIPGNPKAKPIERFFWTKELQFQSCFLSYRGNNIQNRPEGVDKRIKVGDDVLDWDAFLSCLSNYISFYNSNSHSGHGMSGKSPDEVWGEYFTGNPLRRVSPVSLQLLMMKASRPVKIGRFGIEALNTMYRSEQLMEKQGQLVAYRYNPEDLSEIHVYSLEWEFLCTAQKVHRTAWNDENAVKEIKSLEKKRRRALKEARKADEDLIKVEGGYRMNEQAEPPKKGADIIRIMKTPLDGVQEKIDREKSGEKAQVVQGRFSFGPKPKETDDNERLAKKFMPNLTFGGKAIYD